MCNTVEPPISGHPLVQDTVPKTTSGLEDLLAIMHSLCNTIRILLTPSKLSAGSLEALVVAAAGVILVAVSVPLPKNKAVLER